MHAIRYLWCIPWLLWYSISCASWAWWTSILFIFWGTREKTINGNGSWVAANECVLVSPQQLPYRRVSTSWMTSSWKLRHAVLFPLVVHFLLSRHFTSPLHSKKLEVSLKLKVKCSLNFCWWTLHYWNHGDSCCGWSVGEDELTHRCPGSKTK